MLIAYIARTKIGHPMPTVGGLNQTVWKGRTERGAINAAKRYAGPGHAYRIELCQYERRYASPFKIINGVNPYVGE